MGQREGATHGSAFRPDIQALRAVAVLAVLAFHLRPRWAPGGYVGVDVFFVISGFLITGLLVRELERDGRINLLGFYARRVRRLMPAASAVLLAVAIATPFLLPPSVWEGIYLDVVFSAFNIENWRLAATSVDYLAADSDPSPMQHYWSLSVEEQFYLIWPCLMLAAVAAGKRLGLTTRAALTVALALVTVGSFAVAVVLTRSGAAEAYFVTHTRVWELGVGGLLALSRWRLSARAGYAGAALGLLVIAASIVFLDGRSSVPGIDALLPVLGAALFLVAGRSAQLPLLDAKPVQYVGDISYSIYLWHCRSSSSRTSSSENSSVR